MPIDSPTELPQPYSERQFVASFLAKRFLHGGGTELRVPVLSNVQGSVTLAVTAAAVLAGLVGAIVAWRVSRDLGGARTTAFALTAVAAVSAASLVVLVAAGLRMFGFVHLAYLVGTISVPMVGLAVAARALTTDAVAKPWAAVGLALILPAAVGWYASHIEPYRLRVERVSLTLPGERDGADPLRIGVLSDLQTDDVGSHEHAAVDLLLAEEPDVILLPGDLFQSSDARFAAHEDELRALLGRLEAPGGVFVVRGDCDPGDRVDRAVRGSDIVILDDETADLKVGDRTLRIGGNRLGYNLAPAVALRRELVQEDQADDGIVRILVAHRPDAVLDLPAGSNVDLTVAGHTHGGQIVVPGFGPLMTLTSVPRHVARGGLHEVDGNAIYVSNGVGIERAQAPQVRLFSPPSVGLIELG